MVRALQNPVMSHTIEDIARVAKVSRSAVSVALGPPTYRSGTRISAATRSRIEEVARKIGYQANMMAKGLAGGRTNTLGILWSLNGPHLSESMAESISLNAHLHGYVTQLVNHLSDPAITLKSLSDFKRRGVDAVVMQDNEAVLETPQITQALGQFTAAVVVGSTAWKTPINLIHHDRLPACRQVAEHFAAQGRRCPAILANTGPNDAKIQAFLECAVQHSMKVTDDSLVQVPLKQDLSSAENYWRALEGCFEKGRPFKFDALFCLNDEGAVAAINWLARRGLRVPEDVAVVGFNDNQINGYLNPPLASVDRRDDQVAAAIDELVFSQLSQSDPSPQRRYIPMRFAWRESAGGEVGFPVSGGSL